MPQQLTLNIEHQISEVDPQAWDSLSDEHAFASHQWHTFAETLLPNDTPVYILVSDADGTPVGRASFWLKSDEPLTTLPAYARPAVQGMLQRWPLLVCRMPIAGLSGLILPESPALRGAVFEQIDQAVQDIASSHGASFIMYDYIGESSLPDEKRDLIEVPGPGTYLDLTWPDFDAYISNRRKSVRKDYRRHRNRARDNGIEVHTATQLGPEQIDRAVELINAVSEHHDSVKNPVTRRALQNSHMVNATWLIATVEGEIVGCGALLADGPGGCLAFLGMDYNIRYLYFKLMYSAIETAIEQGVQTLYGGTDAYEFKERLGFELEHNNYVDLMPTNPVLNMVKQALV